MNFVTFFLLVSMAAPEGRGAADAVDRLLAKNLADPTTVISYSVSTELPCEKLSPVMAGGVCVCYTWNAKNLYGAYAGTRTQFAQIVDQDGARIAEIGFDVNRAEALAACNAAGMEVRPGAEISKHVSK